MELPPSRCLTSLIACLLTLAIGTATADDAPRRLESRVVRVALFKNGLGAFTREAAVPEAPGTYALAPLPPPVHGSLWLSYPDGVTVEELVAERAPVEARASTVRELLRANLGRSVTAHLRGRDVPVEGTILEVGPEPAADRPGVQPWAAPRGYAPGYPAPAAPETVLLRTASGVTALPVDEIGRIDLPEPVGRTLASSERSLKLAFGRVTTGGGGKVAIAYLARGITWAPSYRVDLGPDGKAALHMSALVVNEAEDLQRAHVDLVTGVPNLRFADVVSPLALVQGLAEFLGALGQEPQQRPITAGVMSQIATYAEGGPEPPRYGAAAPGAAHEDLHLYPLPEVTLARGAVGWYPLFTLSVPYEHVYEWAIADHVSEEGSYSTSRPAGDELGKVAHGVRLTNAGRVPWTTGPAETRADGTLLAQDTLGYTPPGARSTLPITRAVGVRGEEAEQEETREPYTGTHYGSPLDRVTLRGEFEVASLLGKAIVLEIRKELSGELLEASLAPAVTKKPKGIRRLNPALELAWRLELAPGASQKIAYRYRVLVRR